jgi:RNA polymerase sporulation-specific sigma factor
MSDIELLEKHKTLVDIIYRKRFSNSGVSEPDLKQEGMMALLKAVKTFNADLGIKFETYASRVIRNRMIDIVRKETADIKESGIQIQDHDARENQTPEQFFWSKELGVQINKILKKHCDEIEIAIFKSHYLGRNYDEIALTFDITKKKIDNTIQKVKRVISVFIAEN